MTPDGFLTFLALIAALWTVVPAAARLATRILSLAMTLTTGFALASVLYLQFFKIVRPECALNSALVCRWITIPDAVDPNYIAYGVVLVWLLIVVTALRRPGLSAGQFPTFSRLIGELADEQKFNELITFVSPHLEKLDRAAQRKLSGQRFYDTISARHPKRARIADLIGALNQQDNVARGFEIPKFVAGFILPLLPSGERTKEAAEDVLRRITRSSEMLSYVAGFRPHFGVRLMALKSYYAQTFSDEFLAALIATPGSLIYQEIKQNQNTARRGYALPPSNRLLHFLFSDPRNAEKLAVYKPVGDYVLASLRADTNPTYIAYLNGSAEGFHDEDLNDSTRVAIHFFDIMVQAAMFGGIPWHMWLYYFDSFTDQIVEIYDATDPAIDHTDEWPTRASYLLYRIVATLRDWIVESENLRPDEVHAVIATSAVSHENGNIPKSAALSLGTCIRKIFGSPKISGQFKEYLIDIVFRAIRDLPQAGDRGPLRAAVINSIVQGGPAGANVAYGQRLKAAFDNVDHILHTDLADFEAAINIRYP